MKHNKKLTTTFYQSPDVLHISKALIGKVLVSNVGGLVTSGVIVETEAYRAPEDRASHAYGNRRTERTEVMFAPGGVAYIYICYGIHHLFNIVTGPGESAHAILIRALEPLEGIDIMMERRKMNKIEHKITKGPGALSIAMGFDRSMSGHSLISRDSLFYVEDRNIHFSDDKIATGPRIGCENAGASASWPWRYYVRHHPNVSAKKS